MGDRGEGRACEAGKVKALGGCADGEAEAGGFDIVVGDSGDNDDDDDDDDDDNDDDKM
jgi:hypothetical protein